MPSGRGSFFCASIAEVRQHLGGEHLHVALGEVVGQHAELQHRDQIADAGGVAHAGDLVAHRLRAADECGAARYQLVDRLVARTGAQGLAHLHGVLHRREGHVAGRQQHLPGIVEILVEQGLDAGLGLGPCTLVGVRHVDRHRPAELVA